MEMKGSDGLEQLSVRIKELSGIQGKVGWLPAAKYPDGTPVAYVAAIQEYGNIVHVPIPPRPFIRPAIEAKASQWSRIAAQGAKEILAGNATPDAIMVRVTEAAKGDIAKNIATLTSPPLSPITIGARKFKKEGKKITGKTIGEIARLLSEDELDVSGISTKPLEDTGYMSATLTSVVENAS